MPPKGKARAVPNRSEHYQAVLKEIQAGKEAAKKTLADLRKRRRAEKQRHNRIVKKASMLGASELMEIAGLRKMTMQDLAKFANEMGVADAPGNVIAAPGANPASASTQAHEGSEDEAGEPDGVEAVPPADAGAPILPIGTP